MQLPLITPKTSITQGTYDIWRANNPTKRLNLNASKLANVRRDIVNRERLTKVELQAIQLKVKQEMKIPHLVRQMRM